MGRASGGSNTPHWIRIMRESSEKLTQRRYFSFETRQVTFQLNYCFRESEKVSVIYQN